MIRFLIDEDLPRSTAKLLREAGFESFDVRDIGLRGAKDDAIYHRAQRRELDHHYRGFGVCKYSPLSLRKSSGYSDRKISKRDVSRQTQSDFN